MLSGTLRSLIGLLLLGVSACGEPQQGDTQNQPKPQGAVAPETPGGAAKTPAEGVMPPDSSHAGTLPPAIAISRPDGRTFTLAADPKGRLTLVNLWATWCGPCKAEMPSLDRLAAAHGDRVRVLAVSQDLQGWTPIDRFYETAGISALDKLLDTAGELPMAYKTPGLPLTVLYDAKGREVWRYAGPREWDAPDALTLIFGDR